MTGLIKAAKKFSSIRSEIFQIFSSLADKFQCFFLTTCHKIPVHVAISQ